jgi:uncharacterized protein (UPF0276 family)
MKFAVNYSNSLVRLLKEENVNIDLIKCPDWDGMLTEARPYGKITIHFDLEVGLGNTLKADFSRIQKLLETTETVHVNTHLYTPPYFDPNNHYEVEKINLLWRNEIQHMIKHLNGTIVALEHLPYTHTSKHLLPAADPEMFSQVVKDTNCMFLLDLAHARISADSFGIDVKTYIQSLPLDRLVEVHITGIKTHSGILTDHFELNNDDWDIFRWALDEIETRRWRKPEIIAFEYGGVGQTFFWRTEYDVLKDQVPILYEMIRRIDLP